MSRLDVRFETCASIRKRNFKIIDRWIRCSVRMTSVTVAY